MSVTIEVISVTDDPGIVSTVLVAHARSLAGDRQALTGAHCPR
ncbi:MAG: hypothetical protein ACRDWG_02710 [Actinomycetes bacterium]